MLKLNKKKVCIVGNGISLKNLSLGKIIDDHDVVIRCNFFEIDGYESDVGSKITHWLLSAFFVTKPGIGSRVDCSNLEEVWVSKYKDVAVESVLINVKKYQLIDRTILKEEIKVIPTTGLLGICYAISKFSCPINIVGFGMNDKIEKSHYEKNRCPSWTGHDLDSERLILNKWENQGKIRRLDENNYSIS